jgi:hypothetical protein
MSSLTPVRLIDDITFNILETDLRLAKALPPYGGGDRQHIRQGQGCSCEGSWRRQKGRN